MNFKERIAPDEAFDGVIKVHGVANQPHVFNNDLVTEYETWFWLTKSPTDEDGVETGYRHLPQKVETVSAAVEATRPKPEVIAEAFKTLDDDTLEYKDSQTVSDQEGGVGFRYKLFNTEISRVVPGVFESGMLAVDKNGISEGLIADKITLSKKLVDEVSDVESVMLYTTDDEEQSNPITINGPFASLLILKLTLILLIVI